MSWFGDPYWWGVGWWPGRGRGFCRFYPWLPRGWWAWSYPYAMPPWGVPPWGEVPPEMELSALKAHARWLKGELDAISQRIAELEKEA